MRSVAQRIQSFEDAEILARRRLPRSLYEMIRQGSGQETTLRANLAAFEQIKFRPRAAVHFPEVDTSGTILGHPVEFPVMIAPTGRLRTQHSSGEPGMARAAGRAGVIHIVSCFTGYPIEEVTAAATGPVFFNLYLAGGRENAEEMIERAAKAGCGALVITVDWAAAQQKETSIRDRVDKPVGVDLRSMLRFSPQLAPRPGWTLDFVRDGIQFETPMWLHADGTPTQWWEMSESIVQNVPVWEDLGWIRELWSGPIVLKGLMAPEDARRAIDAGVEAIVVSNHGGRALDGAPATMTVLPEMLAAVDGRMEVFVDGGIRRGSDVVRALAMGANGCLMGRAMTFSHAAAGEEGAYQMLTLVKRGIELTLGSLGCSSVSQLDRGYLYDVPPAVV